MKTFSNMKAFAIAGSMALVLAVGTLAVKAQGPEHHGHGHPGAMGMMGGDDARFMDKALDLTDAQKAQVKALHEAQRATMQPIHQQLEAAHKAIEAASSNGNFNEAAIRAIISQNQEAFTQAIVAEAKMKSDFYKILTPEQQAKLKTLHQDMQQHMKERMERHHKDGANGDQAPPPPPSN